MADHHALVEQHRQFGRHFFEEQDRLRGGPNPALCAPGYTAVLGGNPPMPLAGHTAFAEGFYVGFPDIHHVIEDVIATADRVVVRFVLKGTHTGSFFGIPPTGLPVSIAAHVILLVANGQVTTLFGIFDEAGMLRQLGVLKG